MNNQDFSNLVLETNETIKEYINNYSDSYTNDNVVKLINTLINNVKQIRKSDSVLKNVDSSIRILIFNKINNLIISSLTLTVIIDYFIIKNIFNQDYTINDSIEWFKNTSVNILIEKAKEYASNTNRLHNFYKTADLFDITPIESCIDYQTKHMVSVHDVIVQDVKMSISKYQEKIIDIYNYFLLLKGIVEDELKFLI